MNNKITVCCRCKRAFGPNEAMVLGRDHLDSLCSDPDGYLIFIQSWGTCMGCFGQEPDPSKWALKACVYCDRPLYVSIEKPPRIVACKKICCDAAKAKKRRAILRGTKQCAECGETFTPKRTDSRYCSAACKQKAYRRKAEVLDGGTP